MVHDHDQHHLCFCNVCFSIEMAVKELIVLDVTDWVNENSVYLWIGSDQWASEGSPSSCSCLQSSPNMYICTPTITNKQTPVSENFIFGLEVISGRQNALPPPPPASNPRPRGRSCGLPRIWCLLSGHFWANKYVYFSPATPKKLGPLTVCAGLL